MATVPESAGSGPAPDHQGRIVCRPMVETDLDRVAAIESSSGPEPWSRSLLAGELELPTEANHWVVAEHDVTGTVVGFAGTMVVADEAHILNIAVDPDHRGRGTGTMLLAHLLDAGRRRGAVATTLEVRPTNHAAIALYTSFGFRRAGRRARYYRDGSDALIMWRRPSANGTTEEPS